MTKTVYKEISADEVSAFNPKLDQHLSVIIKHLYSKEIKPYRIFDERLGNDATEFVCELLGLPKKKSDLKKFLSKLTKSQKLQIIRQIFLDPNFKAMENDDWNYYGEYIKHWPKMLRDLLQYSDIYWDGRGKKLVYKKGGTKVISSIGVSATFLQAVFKEPLYEKLKDEINKAYKENLPMAVLVLSRKLIENLVIDLVRTKFGKELDKFYDKNNKRFLDFSVLIRNLSAEKAAFQPYEKDLDKLIPKLHKFKDKANSTAHSIIDITSLEQISAYDIANLAIQLRYIGENVQ